MTGAAPRVGAPSPGRRRARARARALVAAALAALAGAVAAWELLGDDPNTRVLGAALGVGGVATAVALATVARHLVPGAGEAREPRHARPPPCLGCAVAATPTRRRVVGGVAAVAVVGAVGGLVGRSRRARDELRGTAWSAGALVVDRDGRPVRPDDVEIGGLVTVWPADAVGAASAQAVLIRVDPTRLGDEPGAPSATPAGLVAYSRLCTHMGCPLALFQQDPDVLVCPCHLAVFDVYDDGRPVQGPAARRLPQLPLDVGDDGLLRAAGDFDSMVGPGA